MAGGPRFRLLLSALRWRAGISIATLLVAMAAFAAAAGSPLYLAAAEDSALRSALGAATAPVSGLTLTADLNLFGQARLAQGQRLADAVTRRSSHGIDRWFGPGVLTTQIGGSLPGDAVVANGYVVQLVSRQLACQHLSFSSGGCPTAPGQVAISDRSATQVHAGLNSPLVFRLAGKPASQLTVSGIYRPGDFNTPYWWGIPFFNFTPSIPTGAGETPFYLDALFVADATTAALPPQESAALVSEEYPLMRGRVGNSETAQLEAAVRGYATDVANHDAVTLSTHLTGILDRLASDGQSMLAIAGVTGAQLLVLALLVLYGVVSRSSEVREPEVAVARLHGYPVRRVLAVGLLEPLAVITVALPLGVLAAWFGVHAMVGRVFTAATEIDFDLLTLLATVVAYGAAAVSVAVAGRELIARPLADQVRGTRKPLGSRWTAAFDLIVVALSVGALVELAADGVLQSGRTNPLALVAPGLLAVAASIAAVRVMPWICRIGLGPTARSRFVAAFLAVRHAYRRPTTLRTMIVLAIGSSLTTFCVIGWAVADQNRAAVAAFQTGADRVLTVSGPAGSDLQSAVRRADPGGRDAMAALFYPSYGGDLLAVDASRMSAVMAWPHDLTAANLDDIARTLHAPVAADHGVPAIVTPDLVALNGSGIATQISMDNLDGRSVIVDGEMYQLPELPRVGQSGAVVDLDQILRRTTGPVSKDAIEEVWLSPAAGASLMKALDAQGIKVQHIDTAGTAKAALDAGGLALAYQLLVFAGFAALLLAFGASAFNMIAAAPRRAAETAVLRAMGVGDGALGRAFFGEEMLVLGAAIVVGIATGIASAVLTLPAVPEVSGDQLLQLQYPLPVLALLGIAAVSIASVALLTLAIAWWILRLAVPSRLRLALT